MLKALCWRGMRQLRALAAVLLALPLLASAAGLQVSNVLLEFQPSEAAQGLWLTNSGSAPLRAQARVQQWTQVEGSEQLQATRVLVASPPMVEIAPGQQQFIRVVRLQPQTPEQEQAFRLLIDELPAEQGSASGVQFLVRHAVPLFVLPQEGKPLGGRRGITDTSSLKVEIVPDQGSSAQLQIRNQGLQRVRLSELVFVDAKNHSTLLTPGLLGYVLTGAQMRWPLKLAAEQWRMGGKLMARLNDDPEPQSITTIPATP